MTKVTFCILLYGDYPHLARRVLGSIRAHCPRRAYRLVVGGNALGEETLVYVRGLQDAGEIDRLELSGTNLNKCPMMRRMFQGIETEYVWWLDDDSNLIDDGALPRWLGATEASPPEVVMWGQVGVCNHPHAFAVDIPDVVRFVRQADWYRGLPPPSWKPGGGGEFDYEGKGTGNGRWLFVLGGCWLIRTTVIHALDWPDRRLIKMGDDVLLGEAVRQHGWRLGNIGSPGVAVNTEPRRGSGGCQQVSILPRRPALAGAGSSLDTWT